MKTSEDDVMRPCSFAHTGILLFILAAWPNKSYADDPAIVQPGDGLIKIIDRQLLANPASYGFTDDASAVRKWAQQKRLEIIAKAEIKDHTIQCISGFSQECFLRVNANGTLEYGTRLRLVPPPPESSSYFRDMFKAVTEDPSKPTTEQSKPLKKPSQSQENPPPTPPKTIGVADFSFSPLVGGSVEENSSALNINVSGGFAGSLFASATPTMHGEISGGYQYFSQKTELAHSDLSPASISSDLSSGTIRALFGSGFDFGDRINARMALLPMTFFVDAKWQNMLSFGPYIVSRVYGGWGIPFIRTGIKSSLDAKTNVTSFKLNPQENFFLVMVGVSGVSVLVDNSETTRDNYDEDSEETLGALGPYLRLNWRYDWWGLNMVVVGLPMLDPEYAEGSITAQVHIPISDNNTVTLDPGLTASWITSSHKHHHTPSSFTLQPGLQLSIKL